MKSRSIVLLAVLTAATVSATAPASLANINGEPVTGPEVLAEFVKIHGGHAKFLGGEVEARKFLDKVIDRKLLVQEAYRLGLDQQDDIRKAIDEYRDSKALAYLLRTEIDEKSIPSKDEVRTAWERNTSTVYELRIIEVPAREEAQAVYLATLAGDDFESLARACSVAASRIYGGKLPLVGWGSLDPALEAVAFSLEPGDTAPPVKTASGWVVARMEAIHPVERPEFEKAKERIEGILKKRKLDARRREYSSYLFAKYHARETGVAGSLTSLTEVLATAPEAAAETWDGGALAVKEFVSKQDLQPLKTIPPSTAEEQLQQLLRQTVNDALARREAKDRRIAEVPEVAGDAKGHLEDLMERALYADYILKALTVSDDEARAFFEKNSARWTTPKRWRVAHILAKTRNEASKIRKRLVAGESFAELAKKESIDTQSKNIGGDLGWIKKKDVPPAFSSVLTFQVDQVSEPIESKFGWHLIKVTAIEAPKPMPFAEAKEDVRQSLLESKKTQKRAEWVAKLRAAAKIKIDDKNLREFAKANAA
jgi:parvulin-like peptidyl-prolyl isomerase